MRIGMGYDVHKLARNRKLVIGGVNIPYENGLLGHSDADVLVHAIMDSLLGAAALGDIGQHFPDNNPKYKGISSIKLLSHVLNLLEQYKYKIENIDATIVAEEPKLAAYIQDMRHNIANTLRIEMHQINIKATTTEGLGFIGEELGIASYSIVLLNKIK